MINLDQFPIVNSLIHLNHAAVGPWPQVTADALKAFADENARQGSLNYVSWMKTEQRLRERLARLIAVDSEQVALVKNTSEGLSLVAYGLDWQAGDNVVGIRQEFPSNRFVWESLASRGVEYRKLDLTARHDPEQALFDLCDASTRLISISAVQFDNGLRMDLSRVGQFCRERGILFCVDAIQQIGSLPFDAGAIGADFVIADGHKWMLSAEGLALFYVRKEVMERLSILQYGWHMTENPGDYTAESFTPAASARRFECGSPNMPGIHALDSSVGLLLETGMETVGRLVTQNSRWLAEALSSINSIEMLTDTADERLSGIVTFRSSRLPAEEVHRGLGERGILCAPRGGGVRLSPHFYTPKEQLGQAVEQVRELVGS